MASDTSGFNRLVAGVKGALRIAQTTRVLAQTGIEWLKGDRPPPPHPPPPTPQPTSKKGKG